MARCRRKWSARSATGWRRHHCSNSRARCRALTPRRSASSATEPRSSAPSVISFSARATVEQVPFQAGQNGAVSGRQRRHGRWPRLRGRRRGKIAAIPGRWLLHRANRPAIDARGLHRGEEHSVIGGVAPQPRGIADLEARHAAILNRNAGQATRFAMIMSDSGERRSAWNPGVSGSRSMAREATMESSASKAAVLEAWTAFASRNIEQIACRLHARCRMDRAAGERDRGRVASHRPHGRRRSRSPASSQSKCISCFATSTSSFAAFAPRAAQ